MVQQSQPSAQPVQDSPHWEQHPEAQQPDFAALGAAFEKTRPSIDTLVKTRKANSLDMIISFAQGDFR